MNSILYLIQEYRNDPSGNWHELTRAVIVFIGVVAYEMAVRLPVKNLFLRSALVYIPTMGLTFVFVWLNQFMNLHPHAVLNRVLWRWYQSPSGFKPLRVL